ncbi:MAG: AAA family ATPase [Sulfurovum sp.]|nr:AAA family ATPase [Sulfurovum sp.]
MKKGNKMLTNFEINDYKCFKDFKIDNLSHINIISGKNNVGKTALLEAISLLNNSKNLRVFKENIISLFELRDLNTEDINGYLENINLMMKSGSKTTHISYKTIDELSEIEIEKVDRYASRYEEFLLMYKSDSEIIEILPLRREDSEHRFGLKRLILQDFFIDSSKPNNTKLTQLYSLIQDLGIQNKFLSYLQIIDPNITNIEPQIRDSETSF